MKFTKIKLTKIKLLAIILAVTPFLITLFLYNSLPDMIPTHWNIDGTVTYGDKFTIIPISTLGILTTIGLFVTPKLDPRRKNYDLFQKYYDYFIVGLNVFLCMMVMLVLSESINPGKIQVSRFVTFAMGIFLASIGNYMPKLKDNFFIGIKNPWTLSSPDVWNKTHRLGGILFFYGGILISILALLLKDDYILFIVFFTLVIVISAIPTAMSYIWYKKLNTKN